MRICFFGDSFVNGTGDPACLGWAGRICAEARRNGCDLTYYNLGVRRDTSSDVAQRWRRETSVRLPVGIEARLVFSFGVNDCVVEDGRQRVSPDTTLANAKAIIAQASGWRPTLFVGPPPIGDDATNARVKSLSRDLQALCRELEVPYLDSFQSLSTSDVWMREVVAGDGAHPSAGGYAVFASLVGGWASWRAWIARLG